MMFSWLFIRYSLVTFVFWAFLLTPAALRAAGADLFLSPASGSYTVGELFSTLVNVNSGGVAINAASGLINFDNNKLEVTDLGSTRSIFSIWTEDPTFSNSAGTIRFSGGLPNPGFIGASGNILRVTFKTRAPGAAGVVFSSGAILANDGKGTNILESFKGGVYTVASVAAKKPGPPPQAPPFLPEQVGKPVTAPQITEWPRQLEGGDVLTIKGLGFPNGKVLISIQKGQSDPSTEERFAAADGRFTYNYGRPVSSGFYRIWAKNVNNEGATSPSSEVASVEVIEPLFFRFGNIALNYATIVITLLALLIFATLLIVWSWFRIKKWHALHRKEIGEAEDALHRAFDLLKDDIGEQIKLLERAKSKRELTDEEGRIITQLKRDFDDAERYLRKEIEDIDAIDKKKGL